MGALDGKAVFLTGGGSGLGRSVVARFLWEGASVGVLEKSPDGAAALSCDFGDVNLHVIVGDASSPADNRRAVDEVRARFGKIDVFVGNAGIYDNRAGLADIPLDTIPAAFSELFSVNVQGYLLGARAALDELRRTKGCIVFTASVSSHTAGFGGVLYIASKHAVQGLVRQLAIELAPDIRVNGVAPGYVPTELRGLNALGQGRTATGPKPEDLPLGRICTADEYADLYVLLASDAGRVATGTLFMADGGLSVFGPALRRRS